MPRAIRARRGRSPNRQRGRASCRVARLAHGRGASGSTGGLKKQTASGRRRLTWRSVSQGPGAPTARLWSLAAEVERRIARCVYPSAESLVGEAVNKVFAGGAHVLLRDVARHLRARPTRDIELTIRISADECQVAVTKTYGGSGCRTMMLSSALGHKRINSVFF